MSDTIKDTFAQFDVSELSVLDASDALGLPEMGASIVIEYGSDVNELVGELGPDMGFSISCSFSSSSCC
jgi:hypothetical protein